MVHCEFDPVVRACRAALGFGPSGPQVAGAQELGQIHLY